MAYILRPDGNTSHITVEVTLDYARSVVRGFIQVMKCPCGARRITHKLLGDEDGKVKHKPLNVKATKLYNHPATRVVDIDMVVGTVIVLEPTDKEWRRW